MSYKIIADSCCDLTEELKKDSRIQIIPLTLEVDDKQIIDDETYNQKKFIELVKNSKECPKSACPSPQSFMDACEGEAEHIYIITLSQHLSGSYNSAVVGMDMYYEHHGHDKKIEVISSDSACTGETLIALKIMELEEQGLSFEEIVTKARDFLDKMTTFFVLESMDFLKKNGRLTGMAAVLVTALNIKPIMMGDHGVIVKVDQARGLQKALKKLVDRIATEAKNPEERTLAITHCNCKERALALRDSILAKVPFKDTMIVDAAGVSSLYAGDGGIVINY